MFDGAFGDLSLPDPDEIGETGLEQALELDIDLDLDMDLELDMDS